MNTDMIIGGAIAFALPVLGIFAVLLIARSFWCWLLKTSEIVEQLQAANKTMNYVLIEMQKNTDCQAAIIAELRRANSERWQAGQ